YRLLNSSHVMLRTEALTRLSAARGTNKKLIVTYPEALFEKVVLAAALSDNIISLKAGDPLDVNGLLLKLVDKGFERTDFVYEPGQFALRGGILDIYSYGNEKPYRVELFGNDVDSIRIFNPETQLSERKLLQVNIIPNIDNRPDTGRKISLLEFIPENTVIWMQDWAFTRERLAIQEEDLTLFIDHLQAEKVIREQEAEKTNIAAGRPNRGKPLPPERNTDTDDEKLEKLEVSTDEFTSAAEIGSQ